MPRSSTTSSRWRRRREWYDKNVIKLNRQSEPNLVIPKASIRYMFKEEELRRGRRRGKGD